MFSEKTTPISELIKGSPDRPRREPALVIFACLFNVFQIYQTTMLLSQLSIPVDPYDPSSFMSRIILQLFSGLIGWYIAFSILLLIGATLVYFINRRIGSAFILVISIIGFLVGFVSIAFTFIYTFSFLSIITGLMPAVLGLVAGIYGVRSKEPSRSSESQEVI